MLAKQQIFYAALLAGTAQAAAQFPTCITSCVRQAGCSPTDLDCMCKKSSSGTFLTDAVICMNQWCDSTTKFSDLLGPIQSSGCDVPKDTISSAESKAGFDTGSDSTPSATSKTGSSASPSVTVIMSVGEPNKIDASTSAPQVTGSATKASGLSSAVYSDSTAVLTATSKASESLLVAATTLTSAAAAGATGTSTSEDSSDDSTSSSDGSPAGGHTGDSGAATSQASLLAAVMAVGAAISFGW
ncbi:hypothetical protein F4806DRAFT_141175 [Annulohypoxylon nitens]|nr:hypothetical protein F4806DRAFT_141175 [Annulohypoxylon nitens]